MLRGKREHNFQPLRGGFSITLRFGLSTQLGLVLLPLTGQVSLLRVLSQLLRDVDGSQDHQPLGGLFNLLAGSNFWAVEQVRQPAKDPFPVLVDFPYNDDTPIKEVKIIK